MNVYVEDSKLAKFLFSDVRAALLWLPFRVWLGWMWIEAGLHKFESSAWMNGGSALQSYWEKAVTADHAIAFSWYKSFLEFLLNAHAYEWFAKLVTFGEIGVGVALIIGAFTGIAAFTGGFMNLNYIMAGSASTNGLLFVLATWMVLSWKVSGWIGVDQWLLPKLGVPWGVKVKVGEEHGEVDSQEGNFGTG